MVEIDSDEDTEELSPARELAMKKLRESRALEEKIAKLRLKKAFEENIRLKKE
jgi:hypothetical protein